MRRGRLALAGLLAAVAGAFALLGAGAVGADTATNLRSEDDDD